MQIKNYNYTEKEISCLIANDGYLWVGFKQNTSGNCKLKKVSANNPLQVYYSINLAIDEIIKGCVSGSYLYMAFDDSTVLGRRFGLVNPITSTVNYNIPAGITEAPVDIYCDGTYVYFLIPGNAIATNAKILIFTIAGAYSSTIDLATVTKANSFVKVGTEFWVTTYTSPSTFVRVYDDGGWTYTINY